MVSYNDVFLWISGVIMVMIGIEFEKLVDHYMQMEKVQEAGGLRKELTPEICVIMMIHFYNDDFDPIQSMIIAQKVKYQVKQIHSIPF